MARGAVELLEMVLRDVAAAGAEPWYPSAYAQATGLPQDAIDGTLDELRLAELVRLTDWVQGRGQGYAVTPAGEEVLNNPRLLAQLRSGGEVPRAMDITSRRATDPASPREPAATPDRGEAIRSALLGPGRPVVTRTILFVSLAVFGIGMYLAMQQQVLGQFLGFSNDPRVRSIRSQTGSLTLEDLTVRGQWWRLLTYAFVHDGALQLALNLWVFYSTGRLVEKMWGTWRYLALYLISALVGGAAQLLIQPNFEVQGVRFPVEVVGAFGGACGLLAAMGVWVRMNRAYLPREVAQGLMRNVVVAVVLIAFLSFLPGARWAEYLGGGIGGAVAAVPLNFSLYGRGAQRWLGVAGVAAVPLLAFGVLWQSVPANTREDVPADHAEVRKLREQYRPALWDARDAAEETYRRYAKPFLRGEKNPKTDAEAVKEALKEIEAAQARLQQSGAKLEQAGSFRNATVRQFIATARRYVEDYETFYRAFAAALSAPGQWNDRLDALREQQEKAARRDQELRDSPIYERLVDR